MRGKFWRLYLKELQESMNFAVLFAIIGVGWLIFLSIQQVNWGSESVFALSFIPLSLLPLYALFKGFRSFRLEWKSETIYTLLSLPVPRWYLLFAKFLATMTIVTVLSIIFLLGIYLDSRLFLIVNIFHNISRTFGIGFYLQLFLYAYLILWIFCAIGFFLSQFSYLVSKLFNRFSGLISGITFLFTIWIVIRVGSILGKLFFWLPDLSVTNLANYQNQMFILQRDVICFDITPFIGIIAASIGLFFLGVWLLEKVLEV